MELVFQNVYFFRDTIRNNIKFGKPDATEEEIIAAAKAARCHDFIIALPDGYDTVVGEGGGTLSGGEKQRISIARAMLKNAPIIILDDCEIIGLTRRNPINTGISGNMALVYGCVISLVGLVAQPHFTLG